MNSGIEDLERRYRALSRDFQAGRIDAAMFTSKADQLQFQDEWGRYWMIGAQTGAWHYYDGQAWHQADPREADKLPFMDNEGRYWQRGTKSGDWYFYQSETGEWVKPGPGDSPPSPGGRQQAARPTDTVEPAYYQSHLYQQSSDTGPELPSQLEGELYQDDEGRYWAVGGKTGQWYFFDHDGWHSASEFQTAGSPQQPPSSQPYQPPAYQAGGYPAQQSYSYQPPQPQAPYQPPQDPQSSQVYYQPQPQTPHQPAPAPQPAPGYSTDSQSLGPQPAPPASSSDVAANQAAPAPPGGESEAGSWFYFDGKQWLKYSTTEPAVAPPAEAQKAEEKKEEDKEAVAASDTVKAESKGEAVTAEFFEEEPEVVDVEVITVVEPEPEEKSEPVKEAEPPEPRVPEDARPRRTRRPSDVAPTGPAPADASPGPAERTTPDPNRPVTRRKRDTTQEPVIIIPTGAAASNFSSPSPVTSARTPSRPVKAFQSDQRRPRENTAPMEPAAARQASPAPATGRSHGEVTQAMPTAKRAARADTAPVKTAQPARQAAQPQAAPAPQQQQKRHTLGDVLRSLPSTFWTVAGGLILLLIFAFIIVGAMAMLNQGDSSVGGLAVAQSPTPTLAAGPPDATPTPGPTPAGSPQAADAAPTPPTALTFTSPDLGITMEYPETWYREESEDLVILSPVEEGLEAGDEFGASTFWVGKSDASAISELLTEALTHFPPETENLNEGTISIASQTWTSAQIRFEDENLGQGIATIAVTGKDDEGFTIVALAPADEWNSMQPLYQGIINSFRFSSGAVAQSSATRAASSATGSAEDESESTTAASTPTGEKETPAAEEEEEEEETPTPTAKATATPLVYVIQSGDTLLDVAVRFGVTVDELVAKNGLDDPGRLSIGQEIIIPFTAEELAAYESGGGAPSPSQAGSGATTASATSASASTDEETEESAGSAGAATPPAAAPTPAPQTAAAPLSGRIIYPAFNPGTNVYDLWMVDLATTEQTGVASEASQPAFNRDGSLLAYRSWGLGTRGVFFRDFVGGRGGQVTSFVEDGLPTWSPDGFSFAFATRREGDRVPRIYMGNQMGDSNDYSIGFQGEYPATFPDGRLVVKGCLPSGDCGMFTVGAGGGGEQKISSEVSDTAPAVSPDGSKIAFMSHGRGATNWEVWVMNADGSNPKRLTDNGNNDGLPTWSPDGRSIAYVSDQGGSWAIWVMNADGSNQRKVATMKGSPDGEVLRDIDNSKGWLEERISWAP